MSVAITRGWTNIITNLDNELATRGLPSTMEMVTSFGQKVESVLNTVGGSMVFVVDYVMNVYNVMSSVGTFVTYNWGTIDPVIWGVVAALGAYCAIMGIIKIIESECILMRVLHTAALIAHNVALGISALATGNAALAQTAFNAALSVCPILPVVVLLGAIVAGLVHINNELGSLEITLLVFKQFL